MEGGKEEKLHDGMSSHMLNDQSAPGQQNPPHGGPHPPPQFYPHFPHAYPPGVYPPAYYLGPSHHHHPGHRMEAMLAGGAAAPYGAYPVGHGGRPFSYGSHGFCKHGKLKHRGVKFRHGKFGKNHGGRFRKWK